jgi:hypothetical protein
VGGGQAVIKIMGTIVGIAAFIAVVYTVDGRWVRKPVYADDLSVVQKRLDTIEQRNIKMSILDLEDRVDNPKLSAERKGKLKERIRLYKEQLQGVGSSNDNNSIKGGK